MAIAAEAGLDLVEIAPNSEPPVAKLMDYGRFRFQAQKKAAELAQEEMSKLAGGMDLPFKLPF